MDVLRTPDERFEALPDFPYAPHYTEIADESGAHLRIAAIDEGPRTAAPVLLLHGEPTWSFLYRKIIARLAAAGHRAVAPDLIGFGRSDKPADRADYTYERHVKWMSDWLVATDLRDITLFCQDWGGLIGLRLVAAFPERFARVVAANTFMPEGSGATPAFEAWLAFSQGVPVFPTPMIVNGGTVRELSEADRNAYEAPYPDESYKAGARQFPALVPVKPEMASVKENREAWKVLERFEKPFLTAFADQDPITRGADARLQARIPGCKGQHHTTIVNAGHFLQEDQPEEIAKVIDDFIRATP
ncbi:haloalkane dehalogenase [Terricaulis silvestris]|uniref:Haloalkane dehalogenase n=1 Tax=Terricaulis silvestris TaxID=2686094 RepID=A0A6I6MNA4_9CAUL|nr:haloalkane dehalogenase [Terricaulis silvestris]QGZ94796.1 Haloalkane dehalogenase [Terricaulis silvestris]